MTPSDMLLYGSLACSAAFYLLAGLMYLLRRPPVPPALPAMSDLGADSPAVANLLANGGSVSADAVPATLFDLAARKIVDIEETEPHKFACRIKATANTDLTRYESRVMRLVQSRASGGLVPAGALTLGSNAEAKGWLRGFRGDVTAEARAHGLCKARWPPQVLTLAGLLVFGAFMLVAIAGHDDDKEVAFWAVTMVIALGTAAISNTIFRDDSQIVTPSGLQAAARWLSLRKYLHDDELFSTLPPTAVAVRDRYIAYGAALGVAAAAVRAIPMGAESDRRAWSNVGGRWRQVTVSYPTVWPPAYGTSPGEAIWAGARTGGIAGLVLFLLWQVIPRLSIGSSDRTERDITAGLLVVAAILVVAIAIGLWLLLAGVVSLFGASTITGDAIRLRQFGGEDMTCHLAVDDGTSDHVRAWRVRPAVYDKLTEYETVTVTVTPLLGYVKDVRRATVARATAPAPVRA